MPRVSEKAREIKTTCSKGHNGEVSCKIDKDIIKIFIPIEAPLVIGSPLETDKEGTIKTEEEFNQHLNRAKEVD